MSLTSYRAAPPRDKPVRTFKNDRRQFNAKGVVPTRPEAREGYQGKAPVVPGVCTNDTPLWKGLRAIFFTIL